MNPHRALRSLFALSFVITAGACTAEEGEGEEPPPLNCDQKFYPDDDGDGFGDPTGASCEQEAGYVARSGDCRDEDPLSHPGVAEVCDTIDNNCDGKVDDADPGLASNAGHEFFRDVDGDGFGTPDTTIKRCVAPTGYVVNDTDCDDDAANVNPQATEVCDQVDNDCDTWTDMADSSLDLATATSWYRDVDNDMFGAGTVMRACQKPSGYVSAQGDCNDNDNLSKPGGSEICDGSDNDCDGGIDGTAALPNRCGPLVGTYSGSYSHQTQEKLGSSVIHNVQCTGTGSAALALNRRPGIQGTFNCIYNGSLGGFEQNQPVTLRANVALDGTVTGTAEHQYDIWSTSKRTYNLTGTQTATGLNLTGTGSWYPHPMSAVPWTVNFSFATTR